MARSVPTETSTREACADQIVQYLKGRESQNKIILDVAQQYFKEEYPKYFKTPAADVLSRLDNLLKHPHSPKKTWAKEAAVKIVARLATYGQNETPPAPEEIPKVKVCKGCGKPLPDAPAQKRYCDECANERKNEAKRRWNAKRKKEKAAAAVEAPSEPQSAEAIPAPDAEPETPDQEPSRTPEPEKQIPVPEEPGCGEEKRDPETGEVYELRKLQAPKELTREKLREIKKLPTDGLRKWIMEFGMNCFNESAKAQFTADAATISQMQHSRALPTKEEPIMATETKLANDFLTECTNHLTALKELFEKKHKQYSAGEDPLANFRFGTDGSWSEMYENGKGYVRKHMANVMQHTIDGDIVDSWNDIAVYAIILSYMIRHYKAEQKNE